MGLLAFLPNWLWHPLGICPAQGSERIDCRSYNWWSGIGSDIGEIVLIGGVFTLIITVIATARRGYKSYRSATECHVDTCHDHGHPVQGTPYRACHAHHPNASHAPGEPITAEHIKAAHERNLRNEALGSGPAGAPVATGGAGRPEEPAHPAETQGVGETDKTVELSDADKTLELSDPDSSG